jgi:two-component system, LuxR family, sensor kinase FixL
MADGAMAARFPLDAAFDSFPAALAVVGPEGAVLWANPSGKQALAGTTHVDPASPGEARPGADGTLWSWVSTPHGDEGHSLLVGHDITERHRREVAATHRARRYADLLASTRDAMISIDRRGRIEELNAAAERMFGWTADELRGRNVHVLMPEPYASEHDGYLSSYEATGRRAAIGRIRTVAAQRRSGEVFPIELSVTEVGLDEDVRYTAFIRDISEKVALQESAVDRERLAAIGTASAAFAHEVGNPLNTMAMHVELLERRLRRSGALDGAVQPSLEALCTEIHRLTHLLDELRGLSRRSHFAVLPEDLRALAEALLSGDKARFDAHNVRVRCEVAAGLRASLVDTEHLRQVLHCLIDNAVDAMPEGGELCVRGEVVDDRIRLEVIDTGCGVPAGLDPFAPFVTTKPEGTGLGLSVARQIASVHGGSLSFVSEPGGGTRFVFELPRRGT